MEKNTKKNTKIICYTNPLYSKFPEINCYSLRKFLGVNFTVREPGRPKKIDEILLHHPTYILIETIRMELRSNTNETITNETLSKFLGMSENYITKKYYKIRRGQIGTIDATAFSFIKKRVLQFFSDNKIRMNDNLKISLKNYEIFASRLKYMRSSRWSRLYHPNLIVDYFRTINTKTRAYWLGFLYADGWITLQGNIYRIGLKVSVRDEDQLDRFIDALGLNIEYKHFYEELQDLDGQIRLIRYYRIVFAHQSMANDLIRLGIKPQKSKVIRLPNLKYNELYLAFFLGYFDGDGERGSSRIWSGSRKFLEDIQGLYDIQNKIQYKKSNLGSAWGLDLGRELFNAMLDNYRDSMKRKRISL